MPKSRRILIVTANRAETGLLEPVMKELRARSDVEAEWCMLQPQSSFVTEIVDSVLHPFFNILQKFKPDIVLVPCDRWEIVYVAAYAYHRNFIVAHFHAGDFGADHPDDLNRRAISCFSHIMLCNEAKSQTALWRAGEERWRTFLVGSTAFDHVNIDTSLCPAEPFDLVILHPDPVSREATLNDLKETIQCVRNTLHVIWLAPNKDINNEVIRAFLEKEKEQRERQDTTKWYFGSFLDIHLDNIPRPQFLGLLKNARRCVGNSSAFIYEKPYLNKTSEVVMVGHRNSEKKPLTAVQTGGSKKIAEILATIPLDERLRRKRLVI